MKLGFDATQRLVSVQALSHLAVKCGDQLHKDAQNRLLWRDKTCLARTLAHHELGSVIIITIIVNLWHVLQAILETLATLKTAADAARRFKACNKPQVFSDSKTWEVITTSG